MAGRRGSVPLSCLLDDRKSFKFHVYVYVRGKRACNPSGIARDKRRLEERFPRNKNLSQAPMAEPEYAESPDPQSQPEPDPTAETEALAEQKRTLKRKLRHAITVANGCARTLGRERAEVVEERRKLEWALLIERVAHQRTRINPNGVKLRPTPAEAEARMAEEKKQREKEEHSRQTRYEHD